MFESKAAMFLYAVSPVHMGAGTALGAIDNPVQRERHTDHPMMAGSGVKGALRHEMMGRWRGPDGKADWKRVSRVFGPDPERGDASEHAGNLSISDAQIVLFPVRCLRQSFVYATCPTAIARVERLLALTDAKVDWKPPLIGGDQAAVVAKAELSTKDRLVLEAYDFATVDAGGFGQVAAWLADHAIAAGEGTGYFRKKVREQTVLISDERFGYFVRNSMVVEPHVRISDETGTADDGGLFYTENVPPESLFVSLVMAATERRSNGNGSNGDAMKAAQMLRELSGALDGQMVQVGGDSTVGRGQVMLRFAGEEVTRG